MDLKAASEPAPRAERFQSTRWSLVAAARRGAAAGTHEALVELCLRYWYPVYAYVRRSGHSSQSAQDVTRAFFEDLLGGVLDDRAARSGSRFRDYLLRALNDFLALDWRKERTANPPTLIVSRLSLDELEARHRSENPVVTTPEHAYRRGYALTLLARALDRLRGEAERAGRLALFEALEPFLTRDALPGQYEEVAQTLSMRAVAVVMAVKRLRQRFRELVEDELAETVGDADALDAERSALREALLP